LPGGTRGRIPATRRFPPPWSVEEYNDACFIVRGNDGQQLAYVYFEDEPGRRSAAKRSPEMKAEHEDDHLEDYHASYCVVCGSGDGAEPSPDGQ